MATHISKNMNILKMAKTPNYKAMKSRQWMIKKTLITGSD